VTLVDAKLGLRKLCPTFNAMVPVPVVSVIIAAALLNVGLVVVQAVALTLPLLLSTNVVTVPVTANALPFQVKLALAPNTPLLLNCICVLAPAGVPDCAIQLKLPLVSDDSTKPLVPATAAGKTRAYEPLAPGLSVSTPVLVLSI
jgi:hypothetical protein